MATSRHEIQYATINGHRRAYLRAGRGPVLLLLHGIGCDNSTWERVVDDLAQDFTVLAPDLLGHGASDKPRADYSLGGYANGMRDLLTVLGIEKVTVVGHSFGGGVAMQFAYQFPERTERVVLVASGGLGREVSPVVRAITTPGFHSVMGALTLPGVRHVNSIALRTLARTGLPYTRDLSEVARIYESFADPRTRTATRHVVRAVVDHRGQVVTMADRAYLTSGLPLCVVWGRKDDVIPVRHAQRAKGLAPWARVEVMDNSGHFPHRDHPERFARLVREFVQGTRPQEYSRAQWRELLVSGAPGVPPRNVERHALQKAGEKARGQGSMKRNARPAEVGGTGVEELAPVRELHATGA